MQDPLLEKLANASELANLPADRIRQYEKDMITELDRQLQLEFAENRGREEEREKALADKKQRAKAMLNHGMDIPLVAEFSGLSEEEIVALK